MRCAPSHEATRIPVRHGAPAEGANFAGDLISDRGFVALPRQAHAEVVDHDRGARARKIERDAAAYAPARAGDDRDLAVHDSHDGPQ